jgi:hypothetical protein
MKNNIQLKIELDARVDTFPIEYWERDILVITEDGDEDICQQGWSVEVHRHNICFTGEFNPDSAVQVLTSGLLTPDELAKIYYADDRDKYSVIENNRASNWEQLGGLFW